MRIYFISYLKTSPSFLATDNKYITTLVFLDYSKTFDRIKSAVFHNIGFDQKAISLMNSYLRTRKQVVKCDNCFLLSIKCVNGVPQGPILGTLLFSIQISSVSSSLADGTLMYLFYKEADITESCKLITSD